MVAKLKLRGQLAINWLHQLQVYQIELEMQNAQLRQAQVGLEESRDRYVDFYDFAPVGYITLDHGGMIEEINLTGASMLSVARNQLPFRRFANYVAKQDQDRWHRYFGDVLKRKQQVACELTLQHDDKPDFYARLDCLCLKHGDRKSVVRIVLADTRLEKRHRQVLKDLEYQKFALDQHSIVAITDLSGTITYANDKFCSISHYSREELLGKNHRLINSGTHPKAFFDEMYRTITAGTVWHGDICNCAKDGSLYWVATTIVPYLGSDGLPFQYVAIRTDITEHRRVEQELVELNKHLAEEVADRTSDLSALAAHVQRIAETERARLARELHDEMGSIMTALTMEVGRLKSKASAPDFLQDLTVIRELIANANQSRRNIINQLYPTVLDDFGFVFAVDLMVKEYRKHSGIEVKIDVTEEDIVISPDHALAAYRITQECLNNIAKHSGASKVQIEVTAKNGFFDMTIHDNGKGMPREIGVNRHGVFGMIERARYLGGSLQIGSDEGGGTTAHLMLPMATAKPKME
jgi:PAS domain S-box-containing protein